MGLNEIREKYLEFFESKDHLRLRSFPLVPQGDSSLLLINSGMAPLKPYFMGQTVPPRNRVTTCQKCIRTPDIERVGKTSRHGTFFEMLGNFSFGDYFKEEAIAWAYEFCAQVMGLPTERLYVSYYHEDMEALEIWRDKIGVDPSHIVPLGREDNFWEIGTGPCGPCSEIYYDRGEEHGCGSESCAVGCDCDRYVEFWNLVFTQFDSDGKGNYSRLEKPNIDTGMGLERLACIMQGVTNLFEVDTIKKILETAASLTGHSYGESEKVDTSLRVITDHIRSTVFLISDGVLPGNEGRGYVLRRLLRRAARHGRLLGINKRFLAELSGTVIELSGGAYPELREKSGYIKKVIDVEEERFDMTIDQGLVILSEHIKTLRKKGLEMLSGEEVFKLYDTFGFPIDLTDEILSEHLLNYDREGFLRLMEEQRERARGARAAIGDAGWSESVLDALDRSFVTRFVGYDSSECEALIYAMVANGEIAGVIREGKSATLILDKTPFYAESGGQVGDRGEIVKDGAVFAVSDCKKSADGKYLHTGRVESGTFSAGDTVSARIDTARREAIMRNHSAAHLLQAALKKVLGDHVEQAGSHVDEKRVRFDFSHFQAMDPEEQGRVEMLVNDAILEGVRVEVSQLPIDEAKKLGAVALFGEKYGDIVRVVNMRGRSVELCGGTHVENTAKIGLFKITGESSVAAGIRRIEAVTGLNVLAILDEHEHMIKLVSEVIKAAPGAVISKIKSLTLSVKDQQREIEKLKSEIAAGKLTGILSRAKKAGDINIIVEKIDNISPDELRAFGDKLRETRDDFAAVFAGVKDGKGTLCAVCGKKAVQKGINAGAIVKEAAAVAGGGGGGRPDSAMAGCKDMSKLQDALSRAQELMLELASK